MRKVFGKLLHREDGQSLVEYALIIALVAITLVAGLGLLAGGVGDSLDSIVAGL